MKFFQSSIKFFLFLTALTPLIISWSTIFPFILGKTLFFRTVIEIALILFLIYLFLNFKTFKHLNFLKSPLFIFLSLFFLSLAVSAVFAENSYRAFWGDLERGEGLFGILHFFAFLIMAVSVFEKKDWLNYFKISLVVGFVVIFYAFLQYFGVKNFPFALMPEARPISYVGNPAFLATHMFFLMMFAAIVFFETSKHPAKAGVAGRVFKLLDSGTSKLLWWRYFSLLIIVLSAAMIFITATRGAILGLGAGVFILLIYFSIFGSQFKDVQPPIRRLNIKKLSIGLLIFITLFSAVFVITRGSEIWQKIPGLNRLAQTKILDVNDPSTQFRLITWKLSWSAFKEKPILGWGSENYIVAYEKYYDPEYAVYGETWLDRAHNKIIDVAVMQGIFGLIAYLGIFWFALRSLFKSRALINSYQLLVPVIMSGLVAYFVQNLFVFDQIISYMTFFAVLGYVMSETDDLKNLPTYQLKNLKTSLKFPLAFIVTAFIVVLGYSLYFYNLVPYIQARLFKASPGISKDVNVVMDYLKKAMWPYNFAQHNIRGSGIDTIYMDQFFYKIEYVGNPKFRPLGDLLIKGMDEVARKEPYDIRVLIREVEMLNGITRVVSEEEAVPLYQKAEKLMREAVKRAPNRQEVYYHLAFNLAGQKRYNEAIETARYAISLNPKAARAHYHLALVSTIAGKNKEALEALAEVDKVDPNLSALMLGDKDATLLIYNVNGRLDKVAELITESLNRGENLAFDRKYYEAALRYYAFKIDAENFIKVANYLKQFKDLKDDMEVLIDLAQKGMWNIINNL
ncbi:MAG: O-antigen ligase family protein [Patescibacteria group bacterium]